MVFIGPMAQSQQVAGQDGSPGFLSSARLLLPAVQAGSWITAGLGIGCLQAVVIEEMVIEEMVSA